jgi:hypothetical protein
LTSSNQRPPSTYTARARRVTAAVSPRSPPRPTLPTFPPAPPASTSSARVRCSLPYFLVAARMLVLAVSVLLTDRLTAGYWIDSSLRIRSERRCGRWERAHAADDALAGHDPWPRARAARAHDALAQRSRDPRPGGLPRRGCVLYICNTPLINERCGIDLHCFFFSEPSVPTWYQ